MVGILIDASEQLVALLLIDNRSLDRNKQYGGTLSETPCSLYLRASFHFDYPILSLSDKIEKMTAFRPPPPQKKKQPSSRQ